MSDKVEFLDESGVSPIVRDYYLLKYEYKI
jgi:hypothetical protein